MLADLILQALKDHESERPRSQQVRLGPSELGGCREYIRNVMVGAPLQPNDGWPAAAVMGTLFGDHLESVLSDRMDAVTQVDVTTTLPNGIVVSGHADVVLPGLNALIDGKTKDGLDEVIRTGASLENKIQVSIYTLGLVQAGVLEEGATAHLIYTDRSGNQQYLHEIVLEWAEILTCIDVCVTRLDEVLDIQSRVDNGDLEAARALRDKAPSFCYSKKVMCPFRDMCWVGSEWNPHEEITNPEEIEALAAFIAAREDEKSAATAKRTLREKLVGVSGKALGHSVNWVEGGRGSALYVTEIK